MRRLNGSTISRYSEPMSDANEEFTDTWLRVVSVISLWNRMNVGLRFVAKYLRLS